MLPELKPPPRWVVLFFIPSFYGFFTWVLAYGLYTLRLIDWHDSPPEGVWVVIFTVVCFGAATIWSHRAYSRTITSFHALQQMRKGRDVAAVAWYTPLRTLIVLHLVGFAGLALHAVYIVGVFGGVSQVIAMLLADSHIVRLTEGHALGIYLSYAGWIAIALTSLRWSAGAAPWWLLAMGVLQFAGNLLFVDRTRPVWLAMVSILIVAPIIPYANIAATLRKRLITAVAAGLVAFFAIGFWVGKTGEYLENYGYVRIPYQLAGLYYYATGSFAYLDAVLEQGEQPERGFQRTLYPIYKLGSILELNDPPPPQILPFEDLPFPTNVATFLEPYFADSGYALMIFAILVHSFGLNMAGIAGLRSWSPWGLFLWATLCFVSMIGFFVPKLVSAPTWFFIVASAFAIAMRRLTPASADDFDTLRALSDAQRLGAQRG
jgi:oligosaccharide repeat unit polymerase